MMRLVSWPRHSRARGLGVLLELRRILLPRLNDHVGDAFIGHLRPAGQREGKHEQTENHEDRDDCVFHHSSLLMVNMKLRGYCKAQSVGIEGNGSLLRRFHLIVTAVCT